MADFFRWTNCEYSDVLAGFYNARTVKAYLTGVVQPSLAALDKQIQDWNESKDPIALVAIDDIEVLRNATVEAYCLAIQSLFERQLRTYLAGCAGFLKKPELVPKVQQARWDRLNELFLELRGIALKDFQQYENLDFLQLLGNVCRHGEGPSLETLRKQHPELWPGLGHQIPGPDGKPMPFVPSGYNLVVVRRQLDAFAESVAGFWDVCEYIYNESIDAKGGSLTQRIPSLRQEFAGKIRQNVEAGLA